MSEEFDRSYWEERYRAHAPDPHRRPNPQLVTEAAGLAPGTALDAGCGEGADAVWLASRGWRVTAVDVAATALRQAREHAGTLGTEVADRIDWVRADLAEWTPGERGFDLVSTHYVHLPLAREVLLGRLAAAVAPGGTLLVVGHHPSDPHSGAHTTAPQAHFTAEEAAAALDPGRWDVRVAEARTRSVTGHDGREITVRDAVLRAQAKVK